LIDDLTERINIIATMESGNISGKVRQNMALISTPLSPVGQGSQ
jgi:hypothetical protein